MHQSTTAPPAVEEFDARALLGFNFPSADLLDASAGLFPAPSRSQSVWGKVAPDCWSEGATALREGPWPRLEVGPGLVRLTRHDLNADERSRARRDSERAGWVDAEVEYQRAMLHEPMWKVELRPDPKPTRGEVVEWSAKSRSNLIRSILSLDLAPIVAADALPVMVTLTLPDRWLEVAPDAETAARKFANFRRAWSDRWGAPSWLWKREFQRRGAPHWHLWTVPPSNDLREFQAWLSAAWTRALDIADPDERARSLNAGTNVSMADGMRARDPKRLAIYFLKESLGGEGKAYQNLPPAEWSGASVGRYWGVVGMDYALRSIDLDPNYAHLVWRVLRGIRRSRRVTRSVSVPRVNQTTGELTYRRMRRRVASRGSAGWVAVNDGPAVGAALARLLDSFESPPRPPTPGELARARRLELLRRLAI